MQQCSFKDPLEFQPVVLPSSTVDGEGARTEALATVSTVDHQPATLNPKSDDMTPSSEKTQALIKLDVGPFKSLQELKAGEMERRAKKRARELTAVILEQEEPSWVSWDRVETGFPDSLLILVDLD